MAYPEGDYANVLRRKALRGEPLPVGPAPDVAAAREAAVAAYRSPPQVAPQVATQERQPGFIESLLPGAGSVPEDRFGPQREQLIAAILREAEQEPEAAPRTQFSQFYTPDFVKEQVNQLRGENTLGTLLAMSGDRALAPVGQEMMRSADPRKFMQEAANREQTRQYQQWQADYTGRRDPDARLGRLTKALGALPDADAGLSGYGDGKKRQSMHAKVAQELPVRAELLDNVRSLRATWRPEYQQLMSDNQGLFAAINSGDFNKIVARNGLEDLFADSLAKPGVTPELVREAARWFSRFERLHNMPIRHENFGSALTATESPRWDAAIGINENTSAEQVEEVLDELLREVDQGSRKRVKTWVNLYDPEAVLSPFVNSDGTTLFDPLEGGSGGGFSDDAYKRERAELLGL